ncbi:unnamed protein product [Coffea canephora]|uniref:DH200=94 genomic scaffold, scaffold_987 n=1 Tax=Coffea canephora TaxID=49390 RepID=A0A068VI25_COFCA|nr:unnamed protein product [Coffea canephora]
MEGENIEAEENLSTVASLEPNSPIERDDSNTACVPRDDCSVQDSILYQLQDIVAKLDMRIRLCIRDSLFRLAQSAGQRQNASDTSSSNKSNRDEVLSKEEINTHNRFLKASEAETETNPIDRTVAHLLFHRPLELTGKIVETPEPNLSAKLLHYDRQPSSSISLQTNNLPRRLENKQILSHEESEVPCLFRKENHKSLEGQLVPLCHGFGRSNAKAMTMEEVAHWKFIKSIFPSKGSISYV